MDAAILAIGSELLGTDKLDTNSLTITEFLERYGFDVVEKAVVGDDEARIAATVRRLASSVRLVVVTGGLGPTRDDCTRAAVARAFSRDLTIDERIVDDIRAKFASFGREMPDVNRRQAEVLEDATLLANRRGTAPGQRLEADGATLFLLPGVPREVTGMLDAYVEPWLREHGEAESGDVARHVLKVACLPESTVEERLEPFYARYGREVIGVLARPGDVRLVLRLSGAQKAEAGVMIDLLRSSIGDAIYTDNADHSLADVVIRGLQRAGRSLVVAESCTGGMMSEWLTRVPGASEVFLGGAISYANALKTSVFGVRESTIESAGAVSESVARAMATGAVARFDADYAIAITGIAGPGGGSEEKPVGTVHLAVAGPGMGGAGNGVSGSSVSGSGGSGVGDPDFGTQVGVLHKRRRFVGDRQMVRTQSAQFALDMLRRALPDAR